MSDRKKIITMVSTTATVGSALGLFGEKIPSSAIIAALNNLLSLVGKSRLGRTTAGLSIGLGFGLSLALLSKYLHAEAIQKRNDLALAIEKLKNEKTALSKELELNKEKVNQLEVKSANDANVIEDLTTQNIHFSEHIQNIQQQGPRLVFSGLPRQQRHHSNEINEEIYSSQGRNTLLGLQKITR